MTTIEIVSDLVCPWCFIGLRRLDAAIADVRRELSYLAMSSSSTSKISVELGGMPGTPRLP